MDALGDLVARERRSGEAASSLSSQSTERRRSEDPALLAPRGKRRYDYHRFCTTAWKTGNFWRRRGVHEGATVAVGDDPEPEVVFAFLGAALLGARTRFGFSDALDARMVVAPRDEIDEYEVSAGCQRVAYGGPPDDPAISHFERDVWSENPAFPERPVAPETAALVASGDSDDREFSHADLLTAASEVADDWDLARGDEVAVRAPLADPGTVVAGIVAPLLAGAAILFPDEETTGDFAVAEGDAPEREVVGPEEVA